MVGLGDKSPAILKRFLSVKPVISSKSSLNAFMRIAGDLLP